jgi:hypothetical protein
MKPDRYKKRNQVSGSDDRARRQIAVEAARRMLGTIGPEPGDPSGRLREATEAEFYAAKRKAAAVLGRPIRPGDLPSDSEVREQALRLIRDADPSEMVVEDQPEPREGEELARLADHVDRFAIYALRLAPLESVKQDPKRHPEGDALFHSLQVFELARDARPFDEEFLVAALLHDVGKAIDPQEPTRAAVETLRGAVSDRTLALVGGHRAYRLARQKPGSPPTVADPALLEDLALLSELDDAGRVPGVPVGTVDEAIAYLRGLEAEIYLDDGNL